MVDYRIYFFDEASGHIHKAETFQATDDEAAIRSVEQNHAAAGKLELWQRARLVKAWPVRKLPSDPVRDAVEASCIAIDHSKALMAEVDAALERPGAARETIANLQGSAFGLRSSSPLRRP